MTIIETLRRGDGKLVELQKIDSGEYLMTGHTGQHTIAADSSPARVSAHWDGFCSMNDVKNEAQRRLTADPKLIDSSRRAARELARCRFFLAMLESRIAGDEAAALNFTTNWAEAGDAEHLRSQLQEICDPDGERKLLDEIDAEIGFLENEPRYELEDKE